MNIEQCVVDYLHRLPMILSDKTYKDKKTTGRHSTLASLQKCARDSFRLTYNIPFGRLNAYHANTIKSTVEDVYYGMKEAR